jgi:PAS domain-containing protein
MSLLCVRGCRGARLLGLSSPAFAPVTVRTPTLLTIPSSDRAFRAVVERLVSDARPESPEVLESRLRLLFARAVVRRRDIAGEPAAWYVYRDGGWRPDLHGAWWEEPGVPRVVLSAEGWMIEANPTALGLLGITASELGTRHFTDFVRPGALDDSLTMFQIVADGDPLTATVLLRPTSGDVIAIDLHSWREGDRVVGFFRLAEDLDAPAEHADVAGPSAVTATPATDAAFRGYVELALARMPEPTIEGLELRLRRLYPHARVEVDGDRWIARRDPTDEAAGEPWWEAPELPRVRYDARALIVEANEAAEALLGRAMVGHHWQEFVTPGSTEQVSAMLAILAEVGRAESRFRMPRADGTLLEFDSWTEVDGEGYTTVMRPRRG